MSDPWKTSAIVPGDPDDERLLRSVHPGDHKNPAPADLYDLVVLGGGTAGLVCAFGAAGLGARVALVERELLGGDCLNTGCVPSKTILAAAAEARSRHGAHPPSSAFGEAMADVRRIRADIAVHDSTARLGAAGIDVFLGDGRFASRDRVEVAGAALAFRRAVIATGARPSIPPVPGLRESAPLTHETLFALTQRPEHLLVLGAGAVGCEMAQAFRRLGVRVTLLDTADRVLSQDDPDASAALLESLQGDGVDVVLGACVIAVAREGDEWILTAGREHRGDALLVAAGRTANVDGLGLDSAGIAADAAGVVVDDRLRTTNPRVFAAGDVATTHRFTHAADAMARIVVRNALFPGTTSNRNLVIPWSTYTDPEVAHVGPRAADLTKRDDLTALTVSFADVDRAKAEQDTRGFARIHVDRKGRIVAATVVGRSAGELISEATLAITHGLTAADLSGTIHPYPTRSEVWRKLGDQARRAQLTPGVRLWLDRWFRFPWR